MDKRYFSYEDIHKDVRFLAERIIASGYAPEIIVAIGTGGFIPARILKTFLKLPILTIGVALYGDDDKRSEGPRKIQWIDEVERKLSGKRILLVDEVDDSRTTLAYCFRELLTHHPAEVGIAVLHNKKKPKSGTFPPELNRYWAARELDDLWFAYPWDAIDIDEHTRQAAAGAEAATT